MARMKDRHIYLVTGIMVSFLLVLLFSFNAFPNLYLYLRIFQEAFSLIRQQYIEPVSENKILEGAMEGVMEVLDENSYILDGSDSRKENPLMFEDIGILLSRGKEGWQVVATLVNSPAYRAGVRTGDLLVRIEEQEISAIYATPLVNKLSGPSFSRVRLTFERKGEIQKYTLRREVFRPKIFRERRENIGYVRITEYQDHIIRELQEILWQFRNEGIKGLILDLRNNPGNIYSPAGKMAAQVVAYFLPSDKLVSYIRGKNLEKDERRFFTLGEPIFLNLPLVILVNQGTAGISEIIAGALKDYQRATVVGMRTYGNASIAHYFNLSDGKILHLTVAQYYAPKGECIDGKGILPDREVIVSPELELKIMKGEKVPDSQREEAFRILQSQLKKVASSANVANR